MSARAEDVAEWLVRYEYRGGGGSEVVTAASEADATAQVMARATPWNPGAECRHVSTVRIIPAGEATEADVESVIDLTWDRRDRGGEYLIVERGTMSCGMRDYVTSHARLVGTATTLTGARRVRTVAKRRLRGYSGRVDIVLRASVALGSASGPYGCYGEGTA